MIAGVIPPPNFSRTAADRVRTFDPAKTKQISSGQRANPLPINVTKQEVSSHIIHFTRNNRQEGYVLVLLKGEPYKFLIFHQMFAMDV